MKKYMKELELKAGMILTSKKYSTIPFRIIAIIEEEQFVLYRAANHHPTVMTQKDFKEFAGDCDYKPEPKSINS